MLGPKALSTHIIVRRNNEINRIVELAGIGKYVACDGVEPAGAAPEHFRSRPDFFCSDSRGDWMDPSTGTNVDSAGSRSTKM